MEDSAAPKDPANAATLPPPGAGLLVDNSFKNLVSIIVCSF